MIQKVVCTVSTYALGRELGHNEAAREFVYQVNGLAEWVGHYRDKPLPESLRAKVLPCVMTITWLRTLVDHVELQHDAGATVIAKARSRAFHKASLSDADAWVSVDDDVECSPRTVAWLLGAIDCDDPRICVAPCLLRRPDGKEVANIEFIETGIHRDVRPFGRAVIDDPLGKGVWASAETLGTLGKARPIAGGGFALVAMNRAAMTAVRDCWTKPRGPLAPSRGSLDWLDDDGEAKLAIFHDELDDDGKWWGEDRTFFRRVPRNVTIEALTMGETCHAGLTLDLERL